MAFTRDYKTNFKFVEQSNQTYYHDIRVFIMGVDVSPWLMSDVAITYSKNGGINSASFTLSNQYNAFVLTEANLIGNGGKGTWRLQNPYSPEGQYSEQAKHAMWTLKNSDGRNVAHRVSSFGPIKGSGHSKASVLEVGKNASQAQSSVTHRYPFAPGSLAIHKFDHVRIFAKNPLTMTNEWMCVFSGFVDLKPFNEDLVYGMSSIKVSCQDIRYAMQRMRTQANPAASIGNENALQFSNGGPVENNPDAGYFNDLVGPNSMTSHVLGGVTFLGTITFLLLGETPIRSADSTAGEISVGNSDTTNVKKALNQVGELELGESITFDPSAANKNQILEEWNDLVLFREFGMMTEAEMIRIGQETHEWGLYSIWKAKVHILRPADGLPTSNLVEASITAGRIGDKIQWSSRLELLLDICDNIDYVFYVSPWGDIIFEFPMWDFSPKDYGSRYEEVYKFVNHIVSRDINDEGGEAISALTVESSQLQAETKPSDETPNNINGYASNRELTRTIFSNALASRIGVQVKTVVKPGIINQDLLAQYGLIEFAKATADYNKHSFRAQYRPFLMLNRPVYDIDAYKIGTLNNMTTTWRLRESVDIDLDLNYVRRGEIGSEGNVVFRFITGGEASTISYNKIYTDRSLGGTGVGDTGNKAKEGEE